MPTMEWHYSTGLHYIHFLRLVDGRNEINVFYAKRKTRKKVRALEKQSLATLIVINLNMFNTGPLLIENKQKFYFKVLPSVSSESNTMCWLNFCTCLKRTIFNISTEFHVRGLCGLGNRARDILTVRVRLHWASASMLRQLCNSTSNTVLIENNGVTRKWVDSIVFNENSIASIMQCCHSIDADVWCKRALNRTSMIRSIVQHSTVASSLSYGLFYRTKRSILWSSENRRSRNVGIKWINNRYWFGVTQSILFCGWYLSLNSPTFPKRSVCSFSILCCLHQVNRFIFSSRRHPL